MERRRILIVDDEEINRVILEEMFQDEYETLEASNGQEAIGLIESNQNIVLMLLDVIMPVMNGFKVLEYMQEHGFLKEIPVILITGEDVLNSDDQAYAYGVADVIHKPFYPHIVRRRSRNIIELYQNERNMKLRLKEQEEAIRAQEKAIRENSEFLVDVLSSAVEARSAETGEHTKRIKYFTRILLKCMMEHFPGYGLTPAQIEEISTASVLHDLGKIGIPDAILLKPGRLEQEEFEIMKTHTTIGCDLLEKTYKNQNSDFYRYCYDICRHHHERWDGKGYPDHLTGEEIPISAHAVAVADVFDALVTPRVYKKEFSCDVAFDMIMNGECGQFSPDILECFRLAKDDFFNIAEVMKREDF